MYRFNCDYLEGAHPNIIKRLTETNLMQTVAYGNDEISKSAKDKIKSACDCADAEVFFLVGGTQANLVVLDSLLQSYEGVIAANTGHISVHEAGAIEHTGHKVLELSASAPIVLIPIAKSAVSVFFPTKRSEETGNGYAISLKLFLSITVIASGFL